MKIHLCNCDRLKSRISLTMETVNEFGEHTSDLHHIQQIFFYKKTFIFGYIVAAVVLDSTDHLALISLDFKCVEDLYIAALIIHCLVRNINK